MADLNQQTEELARIMEQVNREMAMYGQITKSTADQKLDAEVQAATGLKNFTKGAAAGADAVGELAGAAMSAGKAMLDGKKGAAAFNDSIDGMTKAATAAGIALTLLIPGGVIMKGIIAGVTALTAATAGMVKASNEMADKLFKSYSGLAKSGAAASDGMTGVFNDAKKLGLSMNELDSFVGLVGENAGDLALFAGSVFEGRQKFAEMGTAMEPYRKQMIAAGLTQEEINEGAMGYLRLQTRLGQSQKMTTDQLAEGARKYIVEQDALTKLTGQSRKGMEDSMEAARSEQRFRAKLEEVRLTQGEAAAKRLENANIIISSQSKEMGQAFRDTTTGFLGTEAAVKGNITTQAELMRSTQQLIDGQIDEFEMVTNVGKASKQFATDMNMTAQLGVLNDFAIDYAQTLQLGIFTEKNKADAMKKIIKDQEDQGLKGAEAADAITQQYAETIKKQQELNAKFETTVFKGIDNALAITDRLANATDSLATGFEVLGKAVNKLLRIVGLGVENTPEEKAKVEIDKKQDQKNFESASFTEKIQSSLARGIEHAARGAGNLVGSKSLVGLADAAQQERVASESAYLKEKGKFQQVQPADGQQGQPAGVAPSAAGTGRRSAAPASPGPSPSAVPTSVNQLKEAGLTVKQGAAPAPAGGGAPTTAPTRSLTPPPPSAGVPDGQPGPAAPAGQAPGGGNGSLRIGPNADMSGLDSEMMSRLQKFAESTGKAVDVTSAFRSDQKQAELYVRGHILKEQGIHMPAAPKEDQEINYKGKTYQVKGSGKGSLHGVGNAVDIAGMVDKRGSIDDLLANAGLFRPFIKNDHPHVQMLAEGGIVQPTPGGTPAIIGEGGNAEAVIPLKNGAVPVRLFGDSLKSDSEAVPRMPDIESMFSNMSSTMFAAIESLKANAIDSGFDRDLRQEVVEPMTAVSDTEVAMPTAPVTQEPSGLMEFIKETKEANFAMLAMISELVREQRNANDISTRILQVSSN